MIKDFVLGFESVVLGYYEIVNLFLELFPFLSGIVVALALVLGCFFIIGVVYDNQRICRTTK